MYRFVNFKGFADATLDLRTPVTILIGRNGAGKSNAIEAMDLVAGILRGRQIAEVGLPGDVNAAIPVRGGLAECLRKGATAFAIELKRTGPDLDYHFEVRRTVGAAMRPQLKIFESGNVGSRFHFDTSEGRADPLVTASVQGLPASKPWPHPGSTALVATNNSFPQEYQKEFSGLAAQLRAAFGSVTVVDPVPGRLRMPVPEVAGGHVRDCANVPAALNWLCEGTAAQKEQFARIGGLVSHLLEQTNAELEVMPFQGTGMVSFKMRLAGTDYPAYILSDGTLHAIAVATALEIASPGAVVCIEDIDRGVHPSQMRHVLDFVAGAAQRRQLRVVLTTHSEALLNAVSRSELNGVVLCWWDEASKASKLSHLTDLPDVEPFLSPGHLGIDIALQRLNSRLVPADQFAKARAAGVAKTRADLEALSRKIREAP